MAHDDHYFQYNPASHQPTWLWSLNTARGFSRISSYTQFSDWSCYIPWTRNWLVVSTPLKNTSQLGLLFPIYGKTKMFQITNQIDIKNWIIQKISYIPLINQKLVKNSGWFGVSHEKVMVDPLIPMKSETAPRDASSFAVSPQRNRRGAPRVDPRLSVRPQPTKGRCAYQHHQYQGARYYDRI